MHIRRFMIRSGLILIFVFGAFQISQAQIDSLTVVVEGMSCPFCAYGVEKRLKKVDGVKSVEIDMKDGTATLTAKEGQSINISQVPTAIKKTGFTLGTIKVSAVGKILWDERQGFTLQVGGFEQGFLISDLKDAMREKLLSFANSGNTVEIQGTAYEQKLGVWTLFPESVKEVSR